MDSWRNLKLKFTFFYTVIKNRYPILNVVVSFVSFSWVILKWVGKYQLYFSSRFWRGESARGEFSLPSTCIFNNALHYSDQWWLFLLVLLVKGFLYLKSTWRKVSSCLKQCFYLVCHPWCGCSCGQQENANEYILIQEEDWNSV